MWSASKPPSGRQGPWPVSTTTTTTSIRTRRRRTASSCGHRVHPGRRRPHPHDPPHRQQPLRHPLDAQEVSETITGHGRSRGRGGDQRIRRGHRPHRHLQRPRSRHPLHKRSRSVKSSPSASASGPSGRQLPPETNPAMSSGSARRSCVQIPA
jgi:hypothetical protein